MRKHLKSITIISIVLVLIIVIFIAYDQNHKNSMTKYITYEPPMPNPIIYPTEFEDWKESTKVYLETFYDQKIIKIDEDSDYVTFYFEQIYMNPDESVEKVVYLKPEN